MRTFFFNQDRKPDVARDEVSVGCGSEDFPLTSQHSSQRHEHGRDKIIVQGERPRGEFNAIQSALDQQRIDRHRDKVKNDPIETVDYDAPRGLDVKKRAKGHNTESNAGHPIERTFLFEDEMFHDSDNYRDCGANDDESVDARELDDLVRSHDRNIKHRRRRRVFSHFVRFERLEVPGDAIFAILKKIIKRQ